MHKPGYVAQVFKIDAQTLRNWTSDFDSFLSAYAKPPSGSHRRFTDDDLTVFALVKTLRDQGMKTDEIRAALLNNQRGEIPSREQALVEANPEMHIALLQARMEELQTMIFDLTDELENLRPLVIENAGLKMLLKRAEEQLAAAQTENARLNREIGKLSS